MQNPESVRLIDPNHCLEFQESIYPMHIPLDRFRGNILVIGPGEFFPERIFFCDGVRTPIKSIKSILTCDPKKDVIPKSDMINWPIQITIGMPDHIFKPLQLTHIILTATEILKNIPDNSLDAISMMRMPKLLRPLSDGLLPLISRALKPGGIFVASGSANFSLFNQESNYRDITHLVQSLSQRDRLSILEITRLKDEDPCGYTYQDNIGLVMEKI